MSRAPRAGWSRRTAARCCSRTSTRSRVSPPSSPIKRRPRWCNIRSLPEGTRTRRRTRSSRRRTPVGGSTAWTRPISRSTAPTSTARRATPGEDGIHDGFGTDDCFGHGPHVSGTSGGYTYGMAKGVVLVAVRVLNCFGSGTDAQVIAGIDYVTAQKNANPTVPSVANMSLGGGFFQPLNDAVENSIAAGVVYAIAAGNSGAPDACNTSPASAPNALTVGATDINDNMASFSSFGPCVDIFAPGVNTTSDWNNGDQSTNTISGTSMATPHVAGAAALYLETNPSATPAQVTAALTGNATPGRINGIPAGTVNLLLYTGFITTGTPVPPPPVASFTYICPKQGGGRTCTFTGSATDAPGSPFTWDFGDGTTGTGMTVTHSYSRRGTYQVKLTVQGGEGQTNTRLKSVTTGTSG